MATTRLYMTPWRRLDPFSRLAGSFNDSLTGGMAFGGWNPPVSVEETPEELLLTAELPGMTPQDVEVHVEDGVLTVRGEKREERSAESENRRYHVWERSHGSFARSFTLPRSVRADGIAATFENGLLRVRLPKAVEARSRRIPVQGAAGEVPVAPAGGK
jgi:HSP20 family protein